MSVLLTNVSLASITLLVTQKTLKSYFWNACLVSVLWNVNSSSFLHFPGGDGENACQNRTEKWDCKGIFTLILYKVL